MFRLACAAGGTYRTLEKVKLDAFLWKARTFHFLQRLVLQLALLYRKMKQQHSDDSSSFMIVPNAEHDVCFFVTCNACKRHGLNMIYKSYITKTSQIGRI